MAYPANFGTVLKASFPNANPPFDYTPRRTGNVRTLDWDEQAMGVPEPTEQQINDWATDAAPLPASAGDYSGKLFSEWVADHGGDALATAKRQAKEALENQSDLTRAGFQALIILLLDNMQDTVWKGGKPTPQQAWNAFKTKVDSIT